MVCITRELVPSFPTQNQGVLHRQVVVLRCHRNGLPLQVIRGGSVGAARNLCAAYCTGLFICVQRAAPGRIWAVLKGFRERVSERVSGFWWGLLFKV